MPDLALEVPTPKNGGINADGLIYTFHLRHGVHWSSSPPREVSAHDVVRAFKLLCNPVSPVSTPGYYTDTIAGMAAYCASKFGVVGFTESLALEVRNRNIRVCCVAPGSVKTHFGHEPPEKKKSYSLLAEEVAGVIISVLRQPLQAWMSEVIVRPLNLKVGR